MNLEQLGWSASWQSTYNDLSEVGIPARVVMQQRHLYTVCGDEWTDDAEITGRFRFEAAGPADFPVVGDWVVVTREATATLVQGVLPRKTHFARRAAGPKSEQQVVAANVDVVFLVTGLDGDYNIRRIERYLTLAWESGAKPVVVLNKADLCHARDQIVADVEAVAIGVALHLVSAATGEGLENLASHIAPGQTAALLGSSGVGKSTIVNALLGAHRQPVNTVREDDCRGRHTTTHREIIPMPNGGLLMDTPGMRELQLWGEGDGLDHTFADIAALAEQCHYRDCTHSKEPGCAVVRAMEQGELANDRFQSYRKLQREFAYLRRREDRVEQQKEKNRWKQIHKEIKRMQKDRDRDGRR